MQSSMTSATTPGSFLEHLGVARGEIPVSAGMREGLRAWGESASRGNSAGMTKNPLCMCAYAGGFLRDFLVVRRRERV